MNKTDVTLIRPFARGDRETVLELLRESAMFTGEEIAVAQELIDIWLDKPEQKDYIIFTARFAEAAIGYICFGPTPATAATYDLYWIAVAPALQGRGIGKKLLGFAEKEITSRGGRVIIIETSSTQKYAPTRGFYEKNGYIVEALIRDFYRAGDDRLIYVKRIQG